MNTELWYATEVTNHNVPKDCCNERTCSKKETYSAIIKLDGLELSIGLCDEHNAKYSEIRKKAVIKWVDVMAIWCVAANPKKISVRLQVPSVNYKEC